MGADVSGSSASGSHDVRTRDRASNGLLTVTEANGNTATAVMQL